MGKQTTLDELGAMIEHMISYMTENMATKDDMTELKQEIFGLHTQVNSIEGQLRSMNHGKLEVRIADLEEEVFGEVRT